MKQIISLTIETDENKVVVHLEMDKEKFKTTIEPLLASVIHFTNAPKTSP